MKLHLEENRKSSIHSNLLLVEMLRNGNKRTCCKMSLPVNNSDIESCKAKYNKQLIQKMARKLGLR